MATPTRPDLSPEPWQPSFPGQAVGDRSTYAPTDDPGKGSGTVAYELAPASSHLHGWRVFADSFARKFTAPANGFPAGTCLLQVAFRAKGSAPLTEYYYGFTTPEYAAEWARKLAGEANPGKLIPDIQASCVAYRRSR